MRSRTIEYLHELTDSEYMTFFGIGDRNVVMESVTLNAIVEADRLTILSPTKKIESFIREHVREIQRVDFVRYVSMIKFSDLTFRFCRFLYTIDLDSNSNITMNDCTICALHGEASGVEFNRCHFMTKDEIKNLKKFNTSAIQFGRVSDRSSVYRSGTYNNCFLGLGVVAKETTMTGGEIKGCEIRDNNDKPSKFTNVKLTNCKFEQYVPAKNIFSDCVVQRGVIKPFLLPTSTLNDLDNNLNFDEGTTFNRTVLRFVFGGKEVDVKLDGNIEKGRFQRYAEYVAKVNDVANFDIKQTGKRSRKYVLKPSHQFILDNLHRLEKDVLKTLTDFGKLINKDITEQLKIVFNQLEKENK